MRPWRLAIAGAVCAVSTALAPAVRAQDLAPRAYVIAPLGSNAITASYSYNDGQLLFEGTVPINDATGKLSVPSLTYYRSFGLFGRSANALAALGYGVGTFEAEVLGEPFSTRRSGLFDAVFRVSVNLVGAPAMTLGEIRQRKWRQKTLVGASLKVVPPTGQYDPTKLINLGANRWSFKPELGISQSLGGRFLLDGYASVWFFTENPEFFSRNEYVPGVQTQSQDPVGAVELHLSYDVRPRFWVSLDGNFWYGGKSTVNGTENPASLQKNSRIGITASIPITGHQSVKLSYARGAYVRFGGDYQIFTVGWQYSWIDGSKLPPAR
jgi:hypothetical protein